MHRVSVEVWPHVVVNGEEVAFLHDEIENHVVLSESLTIEQAFRLGQRVGLTTRIPIVKLSLDERPSS